MSQPKQAVFVDTSIQVRRTLADSEEYSRLENQLSSPDIHAVSSSYVWMEYQRSVIADYAHVYKTMSLYSDWGHFFSHILDGTRAFRPRSAVRCTQIAGAFYRRGNQNLEIAQYMLDQEIKYGLHTRFWTHVSPISDSITCDLVTKGIVKQSDGKFIVADSCRKENASCHLPRFLDENQTKLQTILEYLKAHPNSIKDQTRVQSLLERALTNSHDVLGQSSCWPLGDIIIILQVPDGAMLWTLDGDYQSLAYCVRFAIISA